MALLVGNREIGANRNSVKVVSTVVLGDATADFHLQIDILEFRAIGYRAKRSREAAGDGAEQKIFRRPSSLDSAKTNRRGEWIAFGAESDLAIPVRPEDHHATTRNLCT